MSSTARPRTLADILKESEIVPPTVLARAQRYSETSGRPLWFVLLREGLLTEDKLFRLLETQLKLPVLSDDQLDGVVVAPELKQAITAVLAGHLGILPLERSTDGRKAALAMVDPTQDLSTLLPKLASHGVVEVRRFLIRFGTLRLGMDMFYNQAWEAGDSAPLIEPIAAPSPSRPEVSPSKPEVPSPSRPDVAPASKPESAAPSRPEVVPPSKPELSASKSDIVPLSKPEVGAPSKPDAAPPSKPDVVASKLDVVPVTKADSIARPEGSAKLEAVPPTRPTPPAVQPLTPARAHPPVHPPPLPPPLPPSLPPPVPSGISQRGESSRSSEGIPSAASLGDRSGAHKPTASGHSTPPRVGPPRIEPPPLPKQAVPAPLPVLRSGPIRRRPPFEKPGGALSSSDLIIEERPSNLNLNRDALRVPTRSFAPDPHSDGMTVPVVDALFRCATTLAEQLAATLDSDWPSLVVAQCSSLCDRIGLLPRAKRELLLIARLHAILTLQLFEKMPLPATRKERLGFVCDTAMEGLLAMLQAEFLDFVKLPQDDEPPLGMRMISTVIESLRLAHQGHSSEVLAQKLRERCGDNDVVRTLLELYVDQPPTFTDRSAPPGLRPAKLPPLPPPSPPSAARPEVRLGWPTPETMPDVPWSCDRVSTLPEEGLLPYPSPTGNIPTLPSG